MSRVHFYINGRFVTQRLTGVQRFAVEVVRALDEQLILLGDEAPQVTLLVPPDARPEAGFGRIKIEATGGLRGHAWEQVALAWRARDGVLLSLCNAGPVAHRRQLVVLHDASVYRETSAYSPLYATAHRLLGRMLSRTAKIATVSRFSRAELSRILKIPEQDMLLAPNGGEHLARLEPDESVIARLGLRGERYFLVVGSRAPHKNMGLALAAADRAAEWQAMK